MTLRTPVQDISKYSTNFVYSFGYDDWHPGTFSLVYGNYSDNNYFYPAKDQQRTRFEQGTWTFAYKFSLPQNVEKHLLINKEDALICQLGYSYVPRYFSLVDNAIERNKNMFLASCGYTLLQHYFYGSPLFIILTVSSSSLGTTIIPIALVTSPVTFRERCRCTMITTREHVIPGAAVPMPIFGMGQ